MIIEVDTNIIENNNISILQYLIGYLLLNKEYKKIDDIKSELGQDILIQILIRLSESRYITSIDSIQNLDYDKIIIRNKFKALINELKDHDFFDELLEEYPTKVIRPDGTTDYLRSDLKRCRKKYSTITNNKLKNHSSILDALKFEVKTRTKEGNLKYMKRLPKWLMEEGWVLYQERMNDITNQNKSQYGTELE